MKWFWMWKRRVYRAKYHSNFSPIKRLRLISKLIYFVFFGLTGLSLLAFALFIFYAKDLPRPDKVVRREGFATKIYDRNGELLYDVFSKQRRTPVKLEQIPQHLKNATIAVEDKNFYLHKGFDLRGIFRAIYNIVVHRKLQGGSTLTQQLVKNVLLSSQRTISRKIKEFILAIQIESKYSKDEILQMYFNESPYGGTAWGVQAAAEVYFNKDVSELSLVESAIIAGLPQRPSLYSPFSDNPKAYISRTQHVLRRMREDGYISSQQEEEALNQLEKVEFASPGSLLKAPHFVMYVKKILEDRYGQQAVEEGGLRVTTSLDLNLQEKAQKIVAEEIAKVEKFHITNGASVIINPSNGEILAMVGSKDYNDPHYDGKVNVTLSLRQPGSAIKPVTYVTAFRKGYTPASLILDTPVSLPVQGQPDYTPVNYDGKFHGPMQLRYALGNSMNIPAVKLLAKIGLEEMLTMAYDMGISTLKPTSENLKRLGFSVTLGGGEVRLLELVSAYSAFANGGLKVEPTAILKITDKDGKILEEIKPTERKRVLTPQEAFLISHILSDNSARLITFGERSALVVPGRTVAVKTGTTNDKRDNWTIGWTPQVIVGVWVGNNDNSPMKELVSGVAGAAPIWRRIIQTFLEDRPNVGFSVPEGIITAEVDIVSGYRAHDDFPARVEYFIKGTEPLDIDPIHVKLKICPGQNKLASLAQIARGDYEEKEFFIFKEEDPVSTDGKNRWQEGIDQWLKNQPDFRYHPPSEYCGENQEIAVIIQKPKDKEEINNNEIKIRAEVVTPNKIVKVEFFIDEELRETVSEKPYEKIFNLDNGPHKVKVRATDDKNNQGEAEIKIGVNVPWNWQPSPTPTFFPFLSPTPSS